MQTEMQDAAGNKELKALLLTAVMGFCQAKLRGCK